LRAEARSLSLVQVLALSDDDALTLFRHQRWGEGEEVVCPHCGMAHRHYFRPTRKIWRCAGCQDDFSVTSGTIFAFHKLPLRLYLAAAILFTNAVKGISALQVGRDLGVSHKTAYVLLHKIRESLLVGRDESALQGEIHVDGAYVGGTVRPENKKEDRVDRRLAENQDPDKRCILVMREAHTEAEVEAGNTGARKTLTFIVKNENQADLGKLAPAYIVKGTVICADVMMMKFIRVSAVAVRRVNHGQAYRADEGTTSNLAESDFSRFRRFHIGQIHQAAPPGQRCQRDRLPGRHPALEQRGDLPRHRAQVRPCPGESRWVRLLAGQPPPGGKPGDLRGSYDRPGRARSVPTSRNEGAGTLQAMHHVEGVLLHLLDQGCAGFQRLACGQRFADLAAAQRHACASRKMSRTIRWHSPGPKKRFQTAVPWPRCAARSLGKTA